MQKFNVDFAGLSIEVNCKYDYTKKYCADYITDRAADYSVTVTEKDIQDEIEISEYNPKPEYAECVCVYREIAKALPFYDRMVFHGAVIEYENNGYIFTAPSGTGKTTHISLWCKLLEGVKIVNGDKPILHIDGGKVTAYSTPYAGKERYQNHSYTSIKSICIIHRGEENKIRKVNSGEVLSEIISQMYLPPTAEAVNKTLDILEEILNSVDVYILECNISENAVKTSFEMMTGENYENKKRICKA